ncbi:hypothetical protein GGI07_005094 [Coemansia sp. Benny D115]|nr:hypothetical protein GGI07_005094 [Coemansia sp. Benny D115]
MQAFRVLSQTARCSSYLAPRFTLSAVSNRVMITKRFQSTDMEFKLLPKHLQPTPELLAESPVSTLAGDLDPLSAPENVNSELWALYVSTMKRLPHKSTVPPRKSVLNWLLQNSTTREELDMIMSLTEHWRMNMRPISPATTHYWAKACIQMKYPELFMTLIMDRWKYRQLPVEYTLSIFIKFLGTLGAEQGGEAADKLLDDAFRVFALFPYYQLRYTADAYGALVEACCEINTDEAWRRALVASEETLSAEKPMITVDALKAMERRSIERGEPEMAKRYGDLAEEVGVKASAEKDVEISQE